MGLHSLIHLCVLIRISKTDALSVLNPIENKTYIVLDIYHNHDEHDSIKKGDLDSNLNIEQIPYDGVGLFWLLGAMKADLN